eukprot:13243232-Alexandrium_andersonii.AAC.1
MECASREPRSVAKPLTRTSVAKTASSGVAPLRKLRAARFCADRGLPYSRLRGLLIARFCADYGLRVALFVG